MTSSDKLVATAPKQFQRSSYITVQNLGRKPRTQLGSSVVSDFLREYLLVLLFGLLAVGVVGGFVGLASLLRPDRPTAGKLENYESGVDPTGNTWSQSQIRYYIFALLFVMFDVEAVFIFPWATRLESLGFFGLAEMVIFIFILALGLAYAWRKGVLRWV